MEKKNSAINDMCMNHCTISSKSKIKASLLYKVEASSKIHENLKKKKALKVTQISIFNGFSNKIYKKCTTYPLIMK